MKKIFITIGLFLSLVLIVQAEMPLGTHPSVPKVSATKAIQIATQFIASSEKANCYCSSATLVESRRMKFPGHARHWVVTFQIVGEKRGKLRHVYIDMDGSASNSSPLPNDRTDAEPPN